MLRRIPGKLRMPVNAAIMAGLFSGASHAWRVYAGEEQLLEASQAVAKDVGLAGTSMYVSEAVIQNINGKTVITSLLSESAKQALGVGVATFIFDQTHSFYALLSGDITREDFYAETGKSLVKSAASGTCAYGTILICASNAIPGGLMVMAVSIGSYMAVNMVFNYFGRIEKRHYVDIDDLLWQLPLAVRFNETILIFDTLSPGRHILHLELMRGSSILREW